MRIIDDGMLPEEEDQVWFSASVRRKIIKIAIAAAALYIGFLIFTYIPYIMTGLTVYTLLLIIIVLSYEHLRHIGLFFAHDHVIICGDGPAAVATIRALSKTAIPLVHLTMGNDTPLADRCADLGAYIIRGNPASVQQLKRVRISRARALIAIDSEDGTNAEIAERVWNLSKAHQGTKALTCLVHLTEPGVTRLLTGAEIWLGSRHGTRLDFFNLYQTGAVFMLSETEVPSRAAGGKPFHIVVIGSGRLGKSLILHAIRLWRDRWPDKPPERCTVTVVDKDASGAVATLRAMLPSIPEWASVRPYDSDVESAPFIQGEFLSGGAATPDAVFVCFENESLGVCAAIRVHEHLASEQVPIIVRTRHNHGICAFLMSISDGCEDCRGIISFPFYERACSPRLLFDNIHELTARAIHEGYLTQQKSGDVLLKDNPSLVSWESLPDSLKESNRHQADAIARRVASVGCRLGPLVNWSLPLYAFGQEDIERLAREEHDRWVTERVQGGWTYGPERDVPLKKTPWIVPFDDLPESEKEKDRSAIRSLPAILARFDLAIIPDRNIRGE